VCDIPEDDLATLSPPAFSVMERTEDHSPTQFCNTCSFVGSPQRICLETGALPLIMAAGPVQLLSSALLHTFPASKCSNQHLDVVQVSLLSAALHETVTCFAKLLK
jgi:hypothetical protein